MFGENRRLKTLGRYPVLGLAAARKEAKLHLAEYNTLPQELKKQSVTFTYAKEQFLASCIARNKERTVKDYTRLLNKHFKFTCSLHELNRSQIMSIITKLSKTPSEQNHAFVAIRTMLNWCIKQGMIEQSPLPSMSFKNKSKNQILSDRELQAIYARAEEFGHPFGVIVQLVILTGQRRSKIAALRRSWIQDDWIVFPEGFTKNKRIHQVPLSSLALNIIASIPDTGDLLFPSRTDEEKPFNGWGKCKARFDTPKGQEHPIVDDYTLHDLRRTFSSNIARLGTPIHVTEKLLNHISGTVSGVAAIYNRYSYMDEMREAVAQHDQYLSDTCDIVLLNEH